MLPIIILLFSLVDILNATTTTTTTIPQHRVRASQRVVPYYAAADETTSLRKPKFWIPVPRDLEVSNSPSTATSSRQSSSKISLRARDKESWKSRIEQQPEDWLMVVKHQNGDIVTQHESPESYHEQQTIKRKHKRRRRLVEGATTTSSTTTTTDDHHHHHRRRRRRRELQVDDKFASSSSGSDVQVGGTPREDEEEDDVLSSSGTTGNSTEDGWNVTSQVVENHNQTSSSGNETTSSTEVYTTATSVDGNNSTTTSSTNDTTTSSLYQPIRIRAILSESDLGGTFLNETEREILFEDILSPAMLAWSAALRVNPVVGNLTVDVAQLYDGITCGPGIDSGLPSVPVPPLHATTGLPDTDLVVYLSIGFSEGQTLQDESEDDSSSSSSSTTENSSFGSNAADVNPNLVMQPSNSSSRWNNTAKKELSSDPPPTCSGDYLAAATYCSTDQYDRPTAGMLHLCVDPNFFVEALVERNIVTIMHELGHVLGFNSQSFAHFRHSDGSPITPRNDVGDVMDTEVECTGTEPRRSETIPLPSEDILQFRTVRGVRVAEIVTPSVRQVVRNHFDCQSLTGAELESGVAFTGDASNSSSHDEASCIGDHLEKRLFRLDLMNPNVEEVPFSLRISSVTLALLADSGWYQVDLSRTAYPSVWGRGAGCTFAEDSCISFDGNVPPSNQPFFCNRTVSAYQLGTTREIQGCSPDLTSKATCSMSQYESDLPTEYRYFDTTFGSSVGGSDPFLDYCPVYSGFSNGACRDRTARNLMLVSDIETFGRRNARCVSGQFRGVTTAFCLSTACVIEDRSLHVRVDGSWKRCSYSGQVLYSDNDGTDQSTVFCPDPVLACPAFYCQRDCLGTGGICDYVTGGCVCESFSVSNSTTSNSTNGTLVIPPDPNSTLEVQSGLCDDLSPSDNGHFYSEVQDSRSPLADPTVSDYYYPTEEDLVRSDSMMRQPWIIVAIAIGGILILLIVGLVVLRYLRARRSSPSDWFRTSGSSDEAAIDESSPDVNKDKFVASMLVDMRMHAPQEGNETEQAPLENASETDRSLTETDGSEGFTVSSLARSESMSARSSSPSVTSDTLSDPSTAEHISRPAPEPVVQSVMRKRIVKDDCK